MTIQDDTHDKLTKAYMARKALAEIRILARQRRKELEAQYKVSKIQKQQERKK